MNQVNPMLGSVGADPPVQTNDATAISVQYDPSSTNPKEIKSTIHQPKSISLQDRGASLQVSTERSSSENLDIASSSPTSESKYNDVLDAKNTSNVEEENKADDDDDDNPVVEKQGAKGEASGSCFPPATTTTVHTTTLKLHSRPASNTPFSTKRKLQGRIDSNWIESMVNIHFFGACPRHPHLRKNELNFFCLGCGPSGGEDSLLCQHCISEHNASCDGACIQLYRYMYHDIVRVATVNNLLELSGIQQYRANGHPAVHLRPMGPPANKSPYSTYCKGGCGRCLDLQWSFCSISCKMGLDTCGNNNKHKHPSHQAFAMPTTTTAAAHHLPPSTILKKPKKNNNSGEDGSAAESFLNETYCATLAGHTTWSEDDEVAMGDMRKNYKRFPCAYLYKKVKGAQKRKPAYPQQSPSI